MAESDFTIEGLDDYIKAFEKLIDKWDEKKKLLFEKIGLILEREIKPFIPVDTSRLADSFFIRVDVGGAFEYVEYATNVEYALYVNDGHVQHKRAIPLDYLSTGGKKKGYKTVEGKGGKMYIILRERYIPGKYFLEKGVQRATPKVEKAGESWMREILREAIGATL